MHGQTTEESLAAQRKERIARTESWLGARAVSHHGVPVVKEAEAADYAERLADQELVQIRQLLANGCKHIVLDVIDPRVIERITSQLTDTEKSQVKFGT